MDEMDPVFKSLADPHRRLLLDALQARNGQTLLELQGYLPMTRFGVMKHLKVLEEAGLVSSRKVGREKFHYLNTVPIQRVYDRWVSKFSKSWARSLTGLKYTLEEETMLAETAETAVQAPTQVFQVYIRTTPERLWQALTDGEMTRQYYFGSRVESDWRAGSPYSYNGDDGNSMVGGDVLESDPPRKLVTSFRPTWNPDSANDPPSKVTYEIEPTGDVCKLTLIHEDLGAESDITRGFFMGWSMILSNLKTLLETGTPLGVTSM